MRYLFCILTFWSFVALGKYSDRALVSLQLSTEGIQSHQLKLLREGLFEVPAHQHFEVHGTESPYFGFGRALRSALRVIHRGSQPKLFVVLDGPGSIMGLGYRGDEYVEYHRLIAMTLNEAHRLEQGFSFIGNLEVNILVGARLADRSFPRNNRKVEELVNQSQAHFNFFAVGIPWQDQLIREKWEALVRRIPRLVSSINPSLSHVKGWNLVSYFTSSGLQHNGLGDSDLPKGRTRIHEHPQILARGGLFSSEERMEAIAKWTPRLDQDLDGIMNRFDQYDRQTQINIVASLIDMQRLPSNPKHQLTLLDSWQQPEALVITHGALELLLRAEEIHPWVFTRLVEIVLSQWGIAKNRAMALLILAGSETPVESPGALKLKEFLFEAQSESFPYLLTLAMEMDKMAYFRPELGGRISEALAQLDQWMHPEEEEAAQTPKRETGISPSQTARVIDLFTRIPNCSDSLDSDPSE